VSAFEFLISFYGILLGLSVAELANGFSRTWDQRHTKEIGWLAPLLGMIMLADLVSFWTNTWLLRDTIEVGYFVALGAAVVTLLYYFAATQIFPREQSPLTPDEHAMAHRRVVVTAMIVSNLLLTLGFKLIMDLPNLSLTIILLTNLPLLAALICVGWLKSRRRVLVAMMLCLPLTVVYKPFMDGVWAGVID
jgi:hypothetical protein